MAPGAKGYGSVPIVYNVIKVYQFVYTHCFLAGTLRKLSCPWGPLPRAEAGPSGARGVSSIDRQALPSAVPCLRQLKSIELAAKTISFLKCDEES